MFMCIRDRIVLSGHNHIGDLGTLQRGPRVGQKSTTGSNHTLCPQCQPSPEVAIQLVDGFFYGKCSQSACFSCLDSQNSRLRLSYVPFRPEPSQESLTLEWPGIAGLSDCCLRSPFIFVERQAGIGGQPPMMIGNSTASLYWY